MGSFHENMHLHILEMYSAGAHSTGVTCAPKQASKLRNWKALMYALQTPHLVFTECSVSAPSGQKNVLRSTPPTHLHLAGAAELQAVGEQCAVSACQK